MKVVFDFSLRGATIAMMATVRLGLKAQHRQEMSGWTGWRHWRGIAKTTAPVETVLIFLILQ